jgi:hypothetical protein
MGAPYSTAQWAEAIAESRAYQGLCVSCAEPLNRAGFCLEGCDGMPLTYHRMQQLAALVRELYIRLWHTPPAGPRTKGLRARLLRVIETVNERLREVAS